jgi:hypothetical protein
MSVADADDDSITRPPNMSAKDSAAAATHVDAEGIL